MPLAVPAAPPLPRLLPIVLPTLAIGGRDDIAATVTGPLRFQSSGRGGVISGAVRLDRSRYRLGQASATSAVPRLIVREINAPEGDDDGLRAPTPGVSSNSGKSTGPRSAAAASVPCRRRANTSFGLTS